MKVLKRSGALEPVQMDKVAARLAALADGLAVDIDRVAVAACAAMYDGIPTTRLDQLAADTAYALSTEHPDYGALAARVLVSDLHKRTPASALDAYEDMEGLLSPEFLDDARALGRAALDELTDHARDYEFDYFGVRTLEKMYLTRVRGAVVERPQHAWLRIAIALWGTQLDRVRETYACLSAKQFTHASPTIFNAGMKHQQLASCFLLGVDDSVDDIFAALAKCARVSKHGGGIGMHVSGVRGRGARIRGTNGQSDGLVPMLRVANAVADYINQGGRRRGSIAVYIEPHHPDVFDVLDLKKNSGDEHLRARDLFYAVWLSDLFMRRVEAGGEWSLFDPDACPGLADAWGDDYAVLYERYEAEGRATRTVPAQDVWFAILRAQIETGVPYVLFKDAVNAKSNQQNLGTIKCSNLCCEICEFTSPDEVAVCTLGSLSLPAFVRRQAGTGQVHYDFEALHAATKVLARNLDRVIDITFYPVPEAERSNTRHRPIGIGVQGLQDAFFELRLPFDSPAARELNARIFETMYHASLEASAELAAGAGCYSTYAGSPASRGLLQPDLWGVTPPDWGGGGWAPDWPRLRDLVARHGLRNSLSVAPMPTASTSQLLGNCECFEPQTSNLYSRRTLAGEFAVLNVRLVKDLLARGLWTTELKNRIVAADGSLADLAEVPPDLKDLYKTAWDLSQKTLIDLAADRGAYVCQSQSMNLFVAEPTFARLSSMHFYSWKRGLKTGIYYLRTKPASRAAQVTVPAECLACSG
jgi:ribonucleoside-diphosphate reductase alpha subunit